MSAGLAIQSPANANEHHGDNAPQRDFLTITIAGQTFGIPVLQVQDVLREQRVTCVPLAPPEVEGSLNLRGRIVTAINMRKRLGLPIRERQAGEKDMSVVVERDGELFSLLIDTVGDVLTLPRKDFQPNPATLDPVWLAVSSGIYRLERQLLVVLDVPKLLGAVQVLR